MNYESINIVHAMCTLTGFFAQKAIVGTYNSNFKMSYSCRFLPITDLCAPPVATAGSKLKKTSNLPNNHVGSSSISNGLKGNGNGAASAVCGIKKQQPVVLIRFPCGDSKHTLMSTIDLNQRITDR